MYRKPKVERFGTLRELTLTGFTGAADGAGHPGVADSGTGTGCTLIPGPGGGVFCPART